MLFCFNKNVPLWALKVHFLLKFSGKVPSEQRYTHFLQTFFQKRKTNKPTNKEIMVP